MPRSSSILLQWEAMAAHRDAYNIDTAQPYTFQPCHSACDDEQDDYESLMMSMLSSGWPATLIRLESVRLICKADL